MNFGRVKIEATSGISMRLLIPTRDMSKIVKIEKKTMTSSIRSFTEKEPIAVESNIFVKKQMPEVQL